MRSANERRRWGIPCCVAYWHEPMPACVSSRSAYWSQIGGSCATRAATACLSGRTGSSPPGPSPTPAPRTAAEVTRLEKLKIPVSKITRWPSPGAGLRLRLDVAGRQRADDGPAWYLVSARPRRRLDARHELGQPPALVGPLEWRPDVAVGAQEVLLELRRASVDRLLLAGDPNEVLGRGRRMLVEPLLEELLGRDAAHDLWIALGLARGRGRLVLLALELLEVADRRAAAR